jgi:hypothetical protein
MTIKHHEPSRDKHYVLHSSRKKENCPLPLHELTWTFLTFITCSSGPSSKKIRWRVETRTEWDIAPMSHPSPYRHSHPLRTPVAFAWRLSTYQNTNSVYQSNRNRGQSDWCEVRDGHNKKLKQFQYEQGNINWNISITKPAVICAVETSRVPILTSLWPKQPHSYHSPQFLEATAGKVPQIRAQQ